MKEQKKLWGLKNVNLLFYLLMQNVDSQLCIITA